MEQLSPYPFASLVLECFRLLDGCSMSLVGLVVRGMVLGLGHCSLQIPNVPRTQESRYKKNA